MSGKSVRGIQYQAFETGDQRGGWGVMVAQGSCGWWFGLSKTWDPQGLTEGNLICLWSVQHLWICRDMNFRSMPGLPELGLGLSQVIMHCYRYDKKHTWSGTWSNVSRAGTKWAWRTHRIQYHYCSRTDSCSFFKRSVSGANHAQKRIPSPSEANFCKEITTSWCLNYHPKHLHHPIHIYIYM